MKRIVLATLTSEESEMLQEKEQVYSTYRTLMQNMFFPDTEKQKVRKQIPTLLHEIRAVRSQLFTKYRIPYFVNNRCRFDPNNSELYIETRQKD